MPCITGNSRAIPPNIAIARKFSRILFHICFVYPIMTAPPPPSQLHPAPQSDPLAGSAPPPPQYGQPGPPGSSPPADVRMQRLQALSGQFEIRADWVMKLRQLESFDVCILLDDSGSMSTVSVGGGGARPPNPYAPMPTRWTELQTTLSVLLPLATALNPSVDVYFLNRPPLLNVSDPSQVAVAFQSPPAGFTPLSKAFRYIMAAKQAVLAEKKLLLLIFTDGQPTDDHGRTDIRTFLNDLASKPPNVYVQMVACTDDEQAVEWMNEADENIPHVDTSDDYHSERQEILRAQGPRFPFSFGDYLTKCLLGPVDSYFDTLDSKSGGGGQKKKGCTIA